MLLYTFFVGLTISAISVSFLTSTVSADATTPSVNILYIASLKGSLGYYKDLAHAYDDSIKAVIEAVNKEGGVNSRHKINLIIKDINGTRSNTRPFIEDAIKHNISGVIGIQGGGILSEAIPVLEKNNLITFAPFVAGSYELRWSPNVMYADVEASIDSMVLIGNLVLVHNMKRIALFHRKDPGFVTISQENLKNYGLNLSYVFPAVDKEISYEDHWSNLVKARPQGILVFGSPGTECEVFIKDVLIKFQGTPLTLAVSSGLIFILESVLTDPEVMAIKNKTVSVTTLYSVPDPYDDRFEVTKQFRNEYDAAKKEKGLQPLEHSYMGALARLRAWVGAKFMISGLESLNGDFELTTMRKKLFNRNNFNVNDLFIGIFAENCTGLRGNMNSGARSFAISDVNCHCNQGGHFLTLLHYNYNDKKFFPGTLITTPSSTCSAKEVKLNRAIVYFQPYRSLRLKKLLEPTLYTVEAESNIVGDLETRQLSSFELMTAYPPNISTRSHKVLYSVQENHFITAITNGFVNLPLPQVITAAVIAPILQAPLPLAVLGFQRNVIHIFPLLDQEVMALAGYIYFQKVGTKLNSTVRDQATYDSILDVHVSLLVLDVPFDGADLLGQEGFEHIKDLAEKTLGTFLSRLSDSTFYEGERDYANILETATYPENSWVLLMGITVDLIPSLVKFLDNNPTVFVFLPFCTISLHYGALVKATDERQASHIVMVTSLPPWVPPTTKYTSPTIHLYHTMVVNHTELQQPLAIMGYLARRFMQALAKGMTQQPTGEDLVRSIFSFSTVVVDEHLSFGPFIDDSCDGLVAKMACEKNFPTTSLRVRTLATESSKVPFQDARSIKFTLERVPPVFIPLPEKKNVLPKWVIPVAVVGALLILALVMILIYFMCCRKTSARDTRNAPKNPNLPFTIMFTDIQRSTSLWAEIPETMGSALDTHHAIIRQLIGKHHGYEVKTIGDAFMIAFQSATDAIALGYELQQAFYKNDWGCTDIDECYKVFDEDFLEENRDNDEMINAITNLTCHLSDEKYKESWNGLRVRIGITTGFGDIKLDEITGGYDYYGGVSNVAARVETAAHGGQVLCTAATHSALQAEGTDPMRFDFLNLGPQPLRGVPEPVVLYQLQTVAGRQFGPLRLDVQCEKEITEDTATTETATASDRPREDEMLVAIIYVVLTTLFSTMSKKKRQTDLHNLCSVWRLKARRQMLKYNRYIGSALQQQALRQQSRHSRLSRNQSDVNSRIGTLGGSRAQLGTSGLNQSNMNHSQFGQSTNYNNNNNNNFNTTNNSICNNNTNNNNNNGKDDATVDAARLYKVTDDEDKYLGVLSNKISSIVIRKLPTKVARTLIRAAASDRDRTMSSFENTNNINKINSSSKLQHQTSTTECEAFTSSDAVGLFEVNRKHSNKPTIGNSQVISIRTSIDESMNNIHNNNNNSNNFNNSH